MGIRRPAAVIERCQPCSHRLGAHPGLPGSRSPHTDCLDQPENNPTRRARILGSELYALELCQGIRHQRVLGGEPQHILFCLGNDALFVCLGNIPCLDRRTDQYAVGATDRHHHRGPDHHTRGDDHGFLDFDGEPKHRRAEPSLGVACRYSEIFQYLFVLGDGVGAVPGNDPARIPVDVGGDAIDRPAPGRGFFHRRRGHLADVSPRYATAAPARGGRRGAVVVHSNRKRHPLARETRRPRPRGGLHDGGLFQHVAHADRLGIIEHLLDDAALACHGSALRLLPAGASRRALSDHYRQGLQAPPHRSGMVEVSRLRVEFVADLSHHRPALSYDALCVVAAALSAADCGRAASPDVSQLRQSPRRRWLRFKTAVEQHIAWRQHGVDHHASRRRDQLLRS